MGETIILIVLIFLAFVGGSIFVFVLSVSNRKQIRILQRELAALREELHGTAAAVSSQEAVAADVACEAAEQHAEQQQEEPVNTSPTPRRSKYLLRSSSPPSHSVADKARSSAGTSRKSWFSTLTDSWMIWLGGVSVGLAGIFMVKYSIERGLLDPAARVILAIITGLLLHGTAEYLRRKKGGHPALAALCGGASITIFAALLAAHHLYDLLPPLVAFGALALVSLATLVLALVHGPVLAILGIFAAYSLPLLVNTGSDSISGALIYISIISASGLLLTRYVVSSWIFDSVVVLSFFWAAAGIFGGTHQPLSVTLYLAVLGYLFTAVPGGDWLLKHRLVEDCPAKHPIKRLARCLDHSDKLFFSLSGLLVLQVINLVLTSFDDSWLYLVPVLPVFILLAIRKKDDFALLGWLSLVGVLVPLVSHFINVDSQLIILPPTLAEQTVLLILFAALFTVYSLFGLITVKSTRYKGFPVSLAAATPVILLALLYTLLRDMRSEPIVIALCLVVGLVLFLLAWKLPLALENRASLLSFLVSAHFAYALAAVYVFEEASLTLALSSEFVLLAVIRKHFRAAELDWLLKLLTGVVIVRLTCNPFLLEYGTGSHWSLWTYGGSALFALTGCRLLPDNEKIRCWLEGAALYLVLLFIASELRYQLYDGQVFISEYNSFEAAINTLLWSAAAFLYLQRARLSESIMAVFYKRLSMLLFLLAGSNHLFFSLLKYNPLFSNQPVSPRPICNLLLLAYGLPLVPMVLAWLLKVVKKQTGLVVTGLSFFFFISIEIRHFFTPRLYLGAGVGDAEIYTYSFVWLVIAVLALVIGARRQLKACYQAGMVALLVVVAKIFFVDMGELEGLYRVASFMGLGISLLGIAFLHKWFQQDAFEEKKRELS